MKYLVQKTVDGFSTAFRQWRAKDTHCRFLHGYALSVELEFQAETLDDRNWVWDFGFLKREEMEPGVSIKDWFSDLLDHTTVLATDDPFLDHFEELHHCGALSLRTLPAVGCEAFAEHIYQHLSARVSELSGGRVKLTKVMVREHAKNAAGVVV